MNEKTKKLILINILHLIVWLFILTPLKSNMFYFLWGGMYMHFYSNIIEE